MIALLDYGAGNLTSVRKALAAVGAEHFTPVDAGEIAMASGLIVPGVGHFSATRKMEGAWRPAILAAVDRGVPLLGICLGMQYLFEGSDEAPGLAGLGLIPGRCTLLPKTVKVPHVGWNALTLVRPSTLLCPSDDGVQVYFTHSYAAPLAGACVATCEHGLAFSAVVERERVYGVQFHPEKSGKPGLAVLRRFLEATRLPGR